jgi:aspartate racemase
MASVGLIGGIGPESTIVYYRLIIARYRAQHPEGRYPSVVINSVDVSRLLDLMNAGETARVADYLVDAVARLRGAGCDVAAIAANTPHVVFDEVQARTALPLISIVEATARSVSAQAIERVGLFGTRFTMQGTFYPDVFRHHGLTVVTPRPDEQDAIHGIYVDELLHDRFLDASRARLLDIAARLSTDEGLGAVILGGTELPLLLTPASTSAAGVRFLDTTGIHADAIVAELVRLEGATA